MVKLPDPESVIGRLAHRIDRVLQAKGWKRSAFAHGKVSSNTVRRVLRGKDARLSTLIALADALECELVVDFKPKETEPQHIAHDL